MRDKQSNVVDAALKSMEQQRRFLENSQRQFDNFLSEGAPAEMRKGMEAATSKLGDVADNLTGLNLSGWTKSIAGTFMNMGSAFNKTIGGAAAGLAGGLSGMFGSKMVKSFGAENRKLIDTINPTKSSAPRNSSLKVLQSISAQMNGVDSNTLATVHKLDDLRSAFGLVDVGDDISEMTKGISELAEEGTRAGSLYTHDIYLEKIMSKLLKIDTDRFKEELIAMKRKAKGGGDDDEDGEMLSNIVSGIMKVISAGWLGAFAPAIAAFAALGPIILGISAIGAALLFFTDPAVQKDLIGVFNDFSQFVIPILTDLGKAVVDALKEMGRPVIQLIKDVMPEVKKFIAILAGVIKDTILPLFVTLSKSVVPAFSKIFQIVLRGLSVVTEGIGKIIKAVTPAIEQLFATFNWLMDQLMPVFDELFKAVSEVFEIIADILGPLARAYSNIVSKLLKKLEPIFKMIVSAFQYIIKGLGPILKVLGSILVGAAEVLEILIDNIEGIIKFFTSWGFLATQAKLAGDKVDFITKIWNSVTGFFSGISNWITGLKNTFSVFLTAQREASAIPKIFSPVMSFFSAVKEFGSFIGNTVLRPVKALAGALSPIMSFVKTFLKFAKILGWPITVIMGVIDFITGFIEGFEKGGILEGLKEGIFKLINGILGAPVRLLTSLMGWIMEKIGLGDIVKSFKKWLVDLIGGTWLGDKVLSFLGIDSEQMAKEEQEEAAAKTQRGDPAELAAPKVDSGAQVDAYNAQQKAALEAAAQQEAQLRELEQKMAEEQKARLAELARLQAEANSKQDQVVVNTSVQQQQQQTHIPTDPENMALLMRNSSMT